MGEGGVFLIVVSSILLFEIRKLRIVFAPEFFSLFSYARCVCMSWIPFSLRFPSVYRLLN